MKDTVYVTTQLTAKKFKLQSLLSIFCIIVGLLMVVQGSGQEPNDPTIVWGSLLILFGFGWRIVNRVRIWWNHD